ncbi:MAG TPA: hypothetical protein VFG46_07075 [Chryseolinea sp.]|nr:hypothetical protein [Chryseolinea sp.]
MKTTDKKFNSPLCLLIIMLLLTHVACSKKDFLSTDVKHQQEDRFPSASFNHFEGGVLFTDIEAGLEILWKASFKERNTYKENLGFFVKDGLLILPNKNNTYKSSKLGALETRLDSGKFYVKFEGTFIEVLGIIHTHPDIYCRPEPSPQNDYQYCNLGLHNYVMDHINLFDAYKNTSGHEVYKRLGPRHAYDKIPLLN